MKILPLQKWLKAVGKEQGRKGKRLFMPTRIALTVRCHLLFVDFSIRNYFLSKRTLSPAGIATSYMYELQRLLHKAFLKRQKHVLLLPNARCTACWQALMACHGWPPVRSTARDTHWRWHTPQGKDHGPELPDLVNMLVLDGGEVAASDAYVPLADRMARLKAAVAKLPQPAAAAA